MVTGIIGRKVGMTQIFDADGTIHPATVIKAGPCVVTQHKTQTRDGYDSAQIGLVEFLKESKLSQPERGHLAKNNVPPVRFIREVPVEVDEKAPDGDTAIKAGDRVLIDIFEGEKFVDVVGVSKGKGFQGVVKRHHFAGGAATHGSMFHRAPGSIGASSFPSRVVPGMRMGGHMGHARVTVRNLEVIDVDTEDNVLVVKGAVPGPNGGYVVVRRSKR